MDEGKEVYFAGDPVIPGTDLSMTERMRRRDQCGDCDGFDGFDLAVIPVGYVHFLFMFRHLMYSQGARVKVVHIYCTLCFAK